MSTTISVVSQTIGFVSEGYYGILLIIIVCSIQIYTAILLGRCWLIAEEIDPSINTKSRYPYSALSEFTYGKSIGKLVTILVDITSFGGGIPNLIVAFQNMQLLGLRLTNGDVNVSFCIWILVVGTILCPFLWLGSPKDMKYLCLLSVSVVFSVFFLVNGSLLFTSEREPKTSNVLVVERSHWEYLLIAFGMVTFQFDIHPNILTIHVDMKYKRMISTAVIISFSVSLVMFEVTSINIYLVFGQSLKSSVLKSLPVTLFFHIASILVAVQLCLTSAISNSALYQHMEDFLNISREFNKKRCILRTLLIILAIVLAECVPKFDIVMSLIGATLISPLVFILPPLIYLKILKIQDRQREPFTFELSMDSADNSMSFNKNILDDRTKASNVLKKPSLINVRGIENFICYSIVSTSLFCTIYATYLNLEDASRHLFCQTCKLYYI